MAIPKKWLDVFQQEEEQYLAWQRGETADVPSFVDAPIGAPEKLEAWNESVTLVVNQEPDYLYAVNNDVELRTLGIRSFNIFGPTGLPVLPSMNLWLVQTNAWKIEVQGKMNKFELIDAVATENEYGNVKAWYNGQEATVKGIKLKMEK